MVELVPELEADVGEEVVKAAGVAHLMAPRPVDMDSYRARVEDKRGKSLVGRAILTRADRGE